MKYSAHIYAKALVEVLSDRRVDDSAAAKNFLKIVRENGDEGHLRKILEEASRFARGKDGVRKVVIASARELTKTQEHELEKFTKSGDIVVRRILPELIAGVRITVNDEMQFDGSLKRKLNRALGSTV